MMIGVIVGVIIGGYVGEDVCNAVGATTVDGVFVDVEEWLVQL